MSSEKSSTDTIFSRIKELVYGKDEVSKDNEILKIDTAIATVSKEVLDKNIRNYAEVVTGLISNNINSDSFQNISYNFVSDIENLSRLVRYVNGEEIYDSITYCARALKVLANGIIASDDIIKKSIQVLETSVSKNQDDKEAINDIKTILDKLKLDDVMQEVIPETLKLGDQFIEIADYKSKDVPIVQSLLTEDAYSSYNGSTSEKTFIDEFNIEYINENVDIQNQSYSKEFLMPVSTKKIKLEFVCEQEEELDINLEEEDANKKSTPELSQIKLIIHDPCTVIKLQSKRYKVCLGYLVLPYFGNNPFPHLGMGGNNTNSSTLNGNIRRSSSFSSMSPYSNIMTSIDSLYKELISRAKGFLKQDDITIDKKEVSSLLSRFIKEADSENMGDSVLFKVRFVPISRMEHFYIPSQKFFPYGEGIFHRITFQAKLLIALESALAMRRISDSSDKRIITLECGSMNRDVVSMIEELKASFKQKKYSIDTMGTISSIPSTITSFEDIYIPQVKGKKFVEFDTLESSVRIRDLAEELKFFRDMVVAALEVPPSYISLEENLSNKNALSFESSIFAHTIIEYQKKFSKQLTSLISKVYMYHKKKRMIDNVVITFPPPKSLQLDRDADKYEIAVRQLQAMVEFGVPKEWAVKRIVDLPWDEIENFKTSNKMDEKIMNYSSDQDQSDTLPDNQFPPQAGGSFN